MFSSALKSFSSNIQSNYSISQNPTAYAGPWKIYDGKKKSIGKQVSVFVFERKSLDSSNGFGARASSSSTRKVHDEVVERLKKEASSLARLRHPSLLELSEPVEETRSGGLMFATEPITASLAGLLRQEDDRERSGGGRSRAKNSDGTDFELDELEIQKGLLQIGKGLEFLHESAGLVHGNLTPDAIYVNAKGDWKIAGLSFTGPAESSSTSSLPPLALSEVLYQDARLPQSVQLNLDFTSPDFAMDNNVTSSADLFSLGLLIISLYNLPHTSPIQTHGNQTTYKKIFSVSSSVPSQNNNFLSTKPIPKDLVSHVLPKLITRRPATRMTAKEFQESRYFDNVLVSTIRFLDTLPAKTPVEKSQFMKGLQKVLPEFPGSVLEKKVLPALLEEMKDRELLSPILVNIFKIIAAISTGKVVMPERVLPRLKEIFLTGAKVPAGERDVGKEAGLMVVLDNMSVIADNCSGKDFKDDVLPIVRLGIDSSTVRVVDRALKCLPVMLPILDFSAVKHELFPAIASVFAKTSSLGIKVRGLEAFVVLCGGMPSEDLDSGDGLSGVMEKKPMKTMGSILDKFTVQEKVVPLLRSIKTKEPAVMMAALDVFKEVGKIADTDFLAANVIPILWTFSLGPLLNLDQFQSYMAQIKIISSKIEREQIKKLQELGTTANASTRTLPATQAASTRNGVPSGQGNTGAEPDFERLVLGRKAGASKDDDPFGEDWASAASAKSQTVQHQPANIVNTNWHNRPSMAPISPTIPMPNASSRSITPDFHSQMGGFPSLQPAPNVSSPPPQSSNFPTYQNPSSSIWATPGTTSMQPMQPLQQMSNPSLATMSSMRPNATMNINSSFSIAPPPTQRTTSSSNYSAFSIAPPPTTSPVYQPNYQNLSLSNLAPLQPQQSQAGTQFSNAGMIGGAATQQQESQKQGLDKYESLL